MSGGGGTPKATQQEKALAQQGARQWNRFVTDFVPATHQNVERTRASVSDARDIGSASSAQGAAATAGMRPSGPGGRGVMGMHRASAGTSAGTAKGVTSARTGLKAREMSGLLGASAVGQGVRDQGTQGMVAVGNRATQRAMQDLENETAFSRGLVSAGATAAGGYYQHQKDNPSGEG